MLERFMAWAAENGWNIVSGKEKRPLPDSIRSRYDVPQEWYDFISTLLVCENSTATKWFMTPDDYTAHEEGFRWNDPELQSLESCDDPADIIAYWDKHLPIFISVEGEYSYYAIDTDNGNIVYGYEPEYEESSFAADDLGTFIDKIISGGIVL